MCRDAAEVTILKGVMSSNGVFLAMDSLKSDTSSLRHSARHARIASGFKFNGVEERVAPA